MPSLPDISFNRDTSLGRSPARSPTKSSRELNQGRALLASPDHKASEPAASKHGRGISKSPSPNGKRVKKGRGFTERFAFVRRYRTPSPEKSPRSYRYGDRNIRRNFDRYVSLYTLFC
jgi:peptidyl-prolyl isomerase G (cyclophilin G)